MSDGDRAYIQEWANLGFGTKVERWPRELRPMLNFTPRDLGEESPGLWVYTTPNYRFVCDVPLARSLIKEYSHAFEGTLFAIQNLPLRLDPKPPEGKFVVRLFQHRAAYLRAGGTQGSAGVYILRSKEILVPMESLGVRKVGNQVAIDRQKYDSGTLVHEITHQVMHDWVNILPVWFVEGIAEYMSAVPFKDARFHFDEIHEGIRQHLETEYRIHKNRSGNYTMDMVTPEDLMEMSHPQWAAAVSNPNGNAGTNYRSAMLLVYYLIHLDGNQDGSSIVAYLHQARTKQNEMLGFMDQYNTAVRDYNSAIESYNTDVKTFNQQLVVFRSSYESYKNRLNTYNRQIDDKVAPDQLIDLGPEPGKPPTPPKKPELPIILADSDINGVIDLSKAELHARKAIFRKRDASQLWLDMEKGFAGQKIRLRPVYLGPLNKSGSPRTFRAVPIQGE